MPSPSSALSGSSSSHSGAPDAATRASVARFAWPDESSRTGTAASCAMPSPSIASPTVPGPEAQGTFERQLAVERKIVVGERQRASLDPARPGAQQAGRETDQARLAAAVRPGHLQCLARPERQIQAFEQQPPAAPQRHVLEPQQLRHSALVLERVHIVVGKAEMMPDLVDHDVRNQLLEADAVERHSARIGRP